MTIEKMQDGNGKEKSENEKDVQKAGILTK